MEGQTIPFVDAHYHMWDMRRQSYPWLNGRGVPDLTSSMGDYSRIRRSYLIEEFLSEAAGSGLAKSVHVEATSTDPVAETRWVQDVAGRVGFPSAIVAFVDLRKASAEAELDSQCQSALVRGIRMTEPGDLVSDPAFRRGFAALARRGLSYDLHTRWPTMDQALDLARTFPTVRIILNHIGGPSSLGDEEFESWRRGVRVLAQAPNVLVKISGLGMADHSWTVATIRRWVLETIDVFGAERCMFGTNWPVDSLYSSYQNVVDAYREIIAGFTPREQQSMLWRNAEHYYRM
jgi:predicted TIM-barrel fold metal-dependent hydrolase